MNLWRYNLVFGVLLVALAGLAVRVVWLVHSPPTAVADWSARSQRMTIPLPARAGTIFARAGRRYVPLAISRQVPSCFADPLLIGDDKLADVSVATGEILRMDPREVLNRMVNRRKGRFVWLRREITEDQAAAVRELGIRGIGILHEWRREYPSHTLASTVVGFRLADGRPGGGLELTQNACLEPRDGRRVVMADAGRRPIWPVAAASRPPRDGGNVFLTLDAVIQGHLEKALRATQEKHGAKWATGVVVDPHTGEVLAMASAPNFDANLFSKVDAELRTNRACSVPFEPGSVFKPLITAAAVQADVVGYDTRIFCENGVYHAPRGGRISDHGEQHGYLTVAEGVIHSSNILMAKIGEMLGNERIHAIVRAYGFGEPTGIDLPAETPGIVRPLDKWDGYSLRRVPFGQEISASSIQLAMGFASVANGGLLLRPRLVERITDNNGVEQWRSEREVVRRVLTPPVARRTLDVMERVVTEGTGRRCRMKHWTSFGKTGTAQIAGPGGYVENAYAGSFVGGAPASDPKLVCLISVYWPDASKAYYGSVVAAPYVRDVLQAGLEYLNVPPDKDAAWARRP